MDLVDSYGRRINYLRLSVTDRCNFRCRYCMPGKGVAALRRDQILSYEDLSRIAREAAFLDVDKIRITGGNNCPGSRCGQPSPCQELGDEETLAPNIRLEMGQ